MSTYFIPNSGEFKNTSEASIMKSTFSNSPLPAYSSNELDKTIQPYYFQTIWSIPEIKMRWVADLFDYICLSTSVVVPGQVLFKNLGG